MGTSLSRVCGRKRNYDDSDEGAEKFEDLLRDAEARIQRESTESTAAPVEVVNMRSDQPADHESPRSSSQVSTESVVLLEQSDLSQSERGAAVARHDTPSRMAAAPGFRKILQRPGEMGSPARGLTLPAQLGVKTPPVRRPQSPAITQSTPPHLARSSPLVMSGGRSSPLVQAGAVRPGQARASLPRAVVAHGAGPQAGLLTSSPAVRGRVYTPR